MARRTGMLGMLATLIAALLVLWAPLAIAQPANGPDREEQTRDNDGDADSDPETTEDESEADESTADEGDNAHPSGKDRSVENSPESNPKQGNSESNQDDSVGPQRCEGVCGEDDKSNAGGGTDAADQDGNNGCGNDDDFDDDNNGWCGKPTDTDTETDTEDEVEGEVIVDKPCDADATMPGVQPCGKSPLPGAQPVDFPEVEGDTIETDMPETLPGVDVNPGEVEDSVLGELITRGGAAGAVAAAATAPAAAVEAAAVEGATLPFTGGSIVQLLVTGLSLVALGGVSVLARR